MNTRILFLFGTVTFALLMGFSIGTLLFGALVMLGVVAVFPQLGGIASLRRGGFPAIGKGFTLIFNIGHFVLHFLWGLTVSNIVLARDIWTPTDRYTPRMVEVPTDDLTDFQRAFLASRITLTPGTLSIGVCSRRQVLLVHTMYPGASPDYAKELRRPMDILLRGLR